MCLAFDQLRDMIEFQEDLIHQLRHVVRRRKSVGEFRLVYVVGAGPGACREHIANGVIRRQRGPDVFGWWGWSQKGAGFS